MTTSTLCSSISSFISTMPRAFAATCRFGTETWAKKKKKKKKKKKRERACVCVCVCVYVMYLWGKNYGSNLCTEVSKTLHEIA